MQPYESKIENNIANKTLSPTCLFKMNVSTRVTLSYD